jgi:hypothetical protein
MASLKINNTSRDNIYTITYRDTQPEHAKRVVQSLVSIFVESNLGDARKDTEAARKFLDQEIAGYEKKLRGSRGPPQGIQDAQSGRPRIPRARTISQMSATQAS